MENPVAETGETVAVAAEPGVVEQEQQQPEQQQEMVPVAALQAERRERQQLQEQNKLMQDHMALMQANNRAPAQQVQDESGGLSDDDVLTYGEAKKFMSQIQKQNQSSVEELRVQQKYSDYHEVVTKHLPDVVKNNPALADTLQNDPNRYELAYYLAKNSDSYRGAKHEVKKSADAQRIVENGNRAGSLSAVGSTSPQSQVSSVKNMSDADFMKMANRNLGRF